MVVEKETNVSLLWGNATDKASHTFGLEHLDCEEIMNSDRAYTATDNQATRTGLRFATDQSSSSGFPGMIALASDPSNRMPDTFGNLCRYDHAVQCSAVPASERYSFLHTGKYEINDDLGAFPILMASIQNRSKRAASPSFIELCMSGDNTSHPFANDPSHESCLV